LAGSFFTRLESLARSLGLAGCFTGSSLQDKMNSKKINPTKDFIAKKYSFSGNEEEG
jgi:hypothetical protein